MTKTPKPTIDAGPLIEAAINSLWGRGARIFRFADIEAELDALATWKKISFFSYSPRAFREISEEICIGAARRGLSTTIVPGLAADGEVLDLTIYVCGEAERWRIPALRDLMQQMLAGKGGWTDDLERTQARLLGYTSEDTEAWIQQNYEISGFWTGFRRVFIGLDVSTEEIHEIALRRAYPAAMDDWWVAVVPSTFRLRSIESSQPVVVRAALREDPMLDAYAEGEVLTFPTLDGVRARRVVASGATLDAILWADLDLVSPRGARRANP